MHILHLRTIGNVKIAIFSSTLWFLLLFPYTSIGGEDGNQAVSSSEDQILYVTNLFASHLSTITVLVSIASAAIAAFGLFGYLNVRETSERHKSALGDSKQRLSKLEEKYENELEKSRNELGSAVKEVRMVRDEYREALAESRRELDKVIAEVIAVRAEETKLAKDLSRLEVAALKIEDMEEESDIEAQYADGKTAKDVPLDKLLIEFLRIYRKWNFNAKRISTWGAERYPSLAGFKEKQIDAELKQLALGNKVRTRMSSRNTVLYGHLTKT